jgi:hypothetical protein
VRRFPLAPPLWQDPDRNPVPRRPADYSSWLYAEGLDESLFRPIVDPLALPAHGEAANVNSVDEVPGSSWFVDRMGGRSLSPEEAARGSCTPSDVEGLRGPWEVTSVKEEGVTPGLHVRAAGGQRYLFKLDSPDQPQRASAADVVGARIYHAFGFFAPCNLVVTLRPEQLWFGPGATSRNDRGQRRPLTRRIVERILGRGLRPPEGWLRGAASRMVEGEPIGPHPTRGVRADDPNDVIPHEDRRELRAARLLAAWIGRFDTREQNSLDTWVEEGGRRFVRHYQIDFGDSLGADWPWADRLSRNVGHGYHFDLGQIVSDFFTLGALKRPWYGQRPRPGGKSFGYFGAEDFDPRRWKPSSPHPAFVRMTWRDALWAVRRIVRFSDAHLRAIVREARLEPALERYLLATLIARRDRIAAAYLRRHVPLAEVRIAGEGSAPALCFTDLGIRHAGVDPARVFYRLELRGGDRLDRLLGSAWLRPAAPRPDRTCARIPLEAARPSVLAPTAPDSDPRRYAVLDIEVRRPAAPAGRLRVHFYDLGPKRGLVAVGLERF